MKPQLRAVDPNQEHVRDTARRLVKQRRQQQPEPIVNIHDRDNPAPRLPVDEILRKSQGEHLGKK